MEAQTVHDGRGFLQDRSSQNQTTACRTRSALIHSTFDNQIIRSSIHKILYYYRPRQGCVFTGVCDSVHRGVHIPACTGADTPGQTPHPTPLGSACWDTHRPWAVHAGIHVPPPWRPLQQTVHIQLECILVLEMSTQDQISKNTGIIKFG